MRKVAKSISKLLEILVFVFLPFVALTLISSNTSLVGGVRSLVVLTGSMEPSIPAGSIVFVAKDNWYFIGDVIAFENKGGLTVSHRIVDKIQKPDGFYYQVKGDANNLADDELVPAEKVLGKSIFHLPFIGRLALFLKTLPGFIALIVLPTLVFVGFELVNIKKEIEKQIEQRILNQLTSS